MRVRFVQSGGVVGASRGCDLESASLPPDEGRELESLVQASGLTASGTFLTASGRDLRSYEIQIDNGANSLTVTFDDQTLPERARPLVSFLRRNANPQSEGPR
jgi:hypothetical protein